MSGTSAEIELIRSFANTVDVMDDVDRLDDGDDFAAWLAEHGLAAEAGPSRADLELARRLRDALRADLLANDADPGAAPSRLAEAASHVPLRLGAGASPVEPAGSGILGALGSVLAAVATVRTRGEWERFKLCPADDCAWAFYDTSRNRSRRWCSMEVCGNRAKVRSYRSRG